MNSPFNRIPLGDGPRFAQVDAADFGLVSKIKWYLHSSGRYATDKKGVLMHRLIMQPAKGMVVDHINHDGLDNRRANLRTCSNAENCAWRKVAQGSVRFRGVTLWKGRYIAQITHRYKHHFIGSFGTPEEAAMAFDAVAIALRGEFAKVNFPAVPS